MDRQLELNDPPTEILHMTAFSAIFWTPREPDDFDGTGRYRERVSDFQVNARVCA